MRLTPAKLRKLEPGTHFDGDLGVRVSPKGLRTFIVKYSVHSKQVMATLAQDAVFPATEMRWLRGERRFALLINRFRWEDTPENPSARKSFERVQSLLFVDEVTRVQVQGVTPGDADTVHSLLDVSFEPGEDGTGRVVMVLAAPLVRWALF